MLGGVTASLSARQSCRCPGYLFIFQIINVYKKLLIALFTNDLWVLMKGGKLGDVRLEYTLAGEYSWVRRHD